MKHLTCQPPARNLDHSRGTMRSTRTFTYAYAYRPFTGGRGGQVKVGAPR
jgi:hypothetical protein